MGWLRGVAAAIREAWRWSRAIERDLGKMEPLPVLDPRDFAPGEVVYLDPARPGWCSPSPAPRDPREVVFPPGCEVLELDAGLVVL